MGIEELAAEYEAAAHIVGERIAAKRERLKRISRRSREASVLISELRVLYRERLEAQKTAKKLRKYYEKTSGKNYVRKEDVK